VNVNGLGPCMVLALRLSIVTKKNHSNLTVICIPVENLTGGLRITNRECWSSSLSAWCAHIEGI
jgi:hypothetical protein